MLPFLASPDLRRIRALFSALRKFVMVTIRLTRRGAKNQPFYHVVVTDSRKRQGGASLELVGYFNPNASITGTRKVHSSPSACAHWSRAIVETSPRSRPSRPPPPEPVSRTGANRRAAWRAGRREGSILCRSTRVAAAATPMAAAPTGWGGKQFRGVARAVGRPCAAGNARGRLRSGRR